MPAVAIFTDYRCPFSRAMIAQLTELGAHVIEYPISILGSRDLAKAVICAPDRAKAMRDAYGRVPLPAGNCDTAGLDQNEAFADAHGITEVPVMVRSDGTVMRGYVDPDRLADWLDTAPQ
ncbi:thioredoxin fold domain-containing protein [Novosphingobium sp.]|uniref:thioredoxin fold domain-containing protein n=1 Tax=Novosphingobium sp. TaxID=1874826 RepID=UPI0026016BD5|nr:thioredoxin fold domain-containing protein [Novosphingobium sp.]